MYEIQTHKEHCIFAYLDHKQDNQINVSILTLLLQQINLLNVINFTFSLMIT